MGGKLGVAMPLRLLPLPLLPVGGSPGPFAECPTQCEQGVADRDAPLPLTRTFVHRLPRQCLVPILKMFTRIEELLDARAATPEELLQSSPFNIPGAIAVSRCFGDRCQPKR